MFRFRCSMVLYLGLTFCFPAICSPMEPIPPGRVRLGGELGERIDRTIENNLMVLDIDNDFLQPFREKNRAGGFIGLGMLIDSAVKLAAYSGEESVIRRKDVLIEEALKTQEEDGYLGIMRPESRLWSLWDIHEMSYLIAGLAADYRLFGNERSLQAAQAIADYVIRGWRAEPERKPGNGAITVYMAVTGSESAMLDLYDLTGERRYLEYCTGLRNLDEWEGPIVLGRWGPIQGHVYAYLSRCLAQLQLNRIQPNPGLMVPSRKALDFLTRRDGLVVSGACGDHECWHDTQEGTTNLGETCATAYLLRWLDRLYREDPDPLYGDLMERSIYNALFGAQSPDGRRIRYYTPFETSREYFDKDTYCCPCNYRRIVAELPNFVYYRTPEGVRVNLYTESTVTLEPVDGKKVSIHQSTDYPVTGQVELTLETEEPVFFEFSFRVPRWCPHAVLRINEENQELNSHEETGILTVARTWKDGDTLRLNLAMENRWVKGRKAQIGRVALMRGPRVFGVNRSAGGIDPDLDLRLVTIDPDSLEGPFPDDTYRKGGIRFTVQAWKPGAFYPSAPKELTLPLTEYPDPGIEAVYFKVPNPNEKGFVGDELVRTEP